MWLNRTKDARTNHDHRQQRPLEAGMREREKERQRSEKSICSNQLLLNYSILHWSPIASKHLCRTFRPIRANTSHYYEFDQFKLSIWNFHTININDRWELKKKQVVKYFSIFLFLKIPIENLALNAMQGKIAEIVTKQSYHDSWWYESWRPFIWCSSLLLQTSEIVKHWHETFRRNNSVAHSTGLIHKHTRCLHRMEWNDWAIFVNYIR